MNPIHEFYTTGLLNGKDFSFDSLELRRHKGDRVHLCLVCGRIEKEYTSSIEQQNGGAGKSRQIWRIPHTVSHQIVHFCSQCSLKLDCRRIGSAWKLIAGRFQIGIAENLYLEQLLEEFESLETLEEFKAFRLKQLAIFSKQHDISGFAEYDQSVGLKYFSCFHQETHRKRRTQEFEVPMAFAKVVKAAGRGELIDVSLLLDETFGNNVIVDPELEKLALWNTDFNAFMEATSTSSNPSTPVVFLEPTTITSICGQCVSLPLPEYNNSLPLLGYNNN